MSPTTPDAPATAMLDVMALPTLREANIARQAAWCPDQVPDLSFRGNELGGEVGEALNVIKKLERERHGWRGSRDTVEHLAEELADVVICADLVAITAGIDLDAAVVAKFNATSEKVGLPHRLARLAPGAAPPGEGVPSVNVRRKAALFTYLIENCSYAYGNGYDEPKEHGIEYQWQQSTPSQPELLATLNESAVRWVKTWHSDIDIDAEPTAYDREMLEYADALQVNVGHVVRARLAATPSPARSDSIRVVSSLDDLTDPERCVLKFLRYTADEGGIRDGQLVSRFDIARSAVTLEGDAKAIDTLVSLGLAESPVLSGYCTTERGVKLFTDQTSPAPARSDQAGAEGQLNVASLFRAALDAAREEGMYVGDDHNCGDDWDSQVEEAKHSAEEAERAAFAALDAALAAAPTPAGEDLPSVEAVSDRVHEAWMASKKAQGVTSRKSEAGEELMVPYAKLSEQAKDLDRGTVKAVYDAIRGLAQPAPAAGTVAALRVAADTESGQ